CASAANGKQIKPSATVNFTTNFPSPAADSGLDFEGRYTPALRHVKGATDARKSHLMTRCSMLFAGCETSVLSPSETAKLETS
ncbi:MAG TPA: hypothetical protein VN175_05770, partial [Rhizomicrobium sp.]|nr:hypothetical protein [Rhizomicrobium sp.]